MYINSLPQSSCHLKCCADLMISSIVVKLFVNTLLFLMYICMLYTIMYECLYILNNLNTIKTSFSANIR